MPERGLAERVWWGRGTGAAAARLALAPAAMLFGAVVRGRNALYDAGALRARTLALPAISIGNLSVGGTGKTPVAAWVAQRARAMGARPAILLRGYGGDEPLVHRALTPDLPVIVDGDRVAAATRARAEGADLVVLDDAFQHRRARRDVDLVLVSAERWTGATPLLPAGPWREPIDSLRRASMALVTRKTAGLEAAEDVASALSRRVPGLRTGVVALLPAGLRRVAADATASLERLQGSRVLAISAIGDPGAFIRQLEALGARVASASFPDHHRFTTDDVLQLTRRGEPADIIVCTLKDAVKLGRCWPRQAAPLWYVSQRVVIERDGEALAALIGSVVRSRAAHATADASVPPKRRLS